MTHVDDHETILNGANPSGAPAFTSGVLWGLSLFLVFCVLFCRLLFILFLLAIVLSVLFRFTDSDYPFGIFKILILVMSNQSISSLFRPGPLWNSWCAGDECVLSTLGYTSI